MKILKFFIFILLFLNFSQNFFLFSYNTIKYSIVSEINNTDIREIKYFTYFTPTYKIYLYEKINTVESKKESEKIKNRPDYNVNIDDY